MRFFTLTLAVTVIAYLSLASVTANEHKGAMSCNKQIPISYYMEHGYDLSEFDIFACPQVGGQRAKFVSLNNCSKGGKFELGKANKTEYDLPDQFFDVYYSTYLHMTVGHFYSSLNDLMDEYIRSTAFEDFRSRIHGIDKAKFVNSQFYRDMRAIFAKNNKIALAYKWFSTYTLRAIGREFDRQYLTPGFISDVNALPESFSGHEKSYLTFVEKYGTHIMISANFGGALYRIAEISRQDVLQKNEDRINNEMRKDAFSLKDPLNIVCEKRAGYREVLKVQARNYTQVMVGGIVDPALYSDEKNAFESFDAAPALVSGEFKPISVLLEDEGKAKNLEKAIKLYMTKAQIKSLVNAIKTNINAGHIPRDDTEAVLNEATQSVNNYNESDLQKLIRKLRHH